MIDAQTIRVLTLEKRTSSNQRSQSQHFQVYQETISATGPKLSKTVQDSKLLSCCLI
jgi:hypothetical protein